MLLCTLTMDKAKDIASLHPWQSKTLSVTGTLGGECSSQALMEGVSEGVIYFCM